MARGMLVSLILIGTAVLAAGQGRAGGNLPVLTNRPIIGVLSAPDHDDFLKSDANPYPGKYYIPASYIKYIESAGAQVVPIKFDITLPEARELHKKLNGVLFPGGGVNVNKGSPYRIITQLFYDLTLEAAEKGEWVPLWGTCLGCEELAILAADRVSILSRFDSENITLPVNYTCSVPSECRLLGPLSTPHDVLSIFQSQQSPVAFNNHRSGVAPADFHADPNLGTNFRMTSTSFDRQGVPFVNSFEHKTAPIYAVQFHPEKPLFEWTVREVIPHNMQATIANQYLARFLVEEASKNARKFPTIEEELDTVIYNWNPTFTGKGADGLHNFDQCYFFN